MSASMAPLAQAESLAPSLAAGAAGRDLRLDYMRGIALLMIFIDHVSGNRFAAFTLQAMGFADAAEVFVFIAGLAAVYAYRKRFIAGGFREVAAAVTQRVRTLYVAHLAMVVGALAVAAAIVAGGSGFDIVLKLGLQPLINDPVQAFLRIPVLLYLPHYMDILPLYVLLLGTLPFILAGFRVHPLLPLAAAGVAYIGANKMGLNAPSFGSESGWFLNPLAWALLFTAGATAAELALRGSFATLARGWKLAVTTAAAAYVVFAFLHAAPWRAFPLLQPVTAFDFILHADKAYLSWHRLLDILAKAWLVAVLVPPGARFMADGLGGAITRAGRNSLPLFIAGTYLSIAGSVILFETDGHPVSHIAVTFGGVALLLWFAGIVERRYSAKSGRSNANATPAIVRDYRASVQPATTR